MRRPSGEGNGRMSKSKFLPFDNRSFGDEWGVEENKRFSSVLRFPVCKGMRA